MNSARATIAVLLWAGILAIGATGCGKLAVTSTSSSKPCTLQVSSQRSVVTVLIDRDEQDVRAQLQALLLTAPPDASIIVRDLDTGRRLGSFTTPPGSVLRGPTPPPALPADPTQAQSYGYHEEITKFNAALGRDQAQLHRSWRAQLTAWATRIARKMAAIRETGPQLTPELSGFTRGLAGSAADISSLEHIPGIHLGTRKILVILDLDVVPTTSPPPLPTGLQGVTVAITGFTGTAADQAAWQMQLKHAGAREAVLMTPSTRDELTAVTEPVLNQPATRHQPGNC